MPALQSLGLGSDGALSFDIIEQLREADEAGQVKPIERNIEKNSEEKAAMVALSTLANTAKSYMKSLGEDQLYLERSSTITGDGVSATVSAGVSAQTITLDVDQLAQEQVVQSQTFASKESTVATGNSSLSISVGSNNFLIDDITASTSLEDLATKINETASEYVTASVLKTDTDEYRLIVKGKETGFENSVTMVEGANLNIGLDDDNAMKSASYTASSSSVVTGANPELELKVDGVKYIVEGVTTSTTLQGLADLINSDTALDGKVHASVVNTGTDQYELYLKSGDGTSLNQPTISKETDINTGFTDIAGATYTNVLQSGSDAEFKYNGVSIKRNSNTVDDIVTGLTLNLTEVTDAGKEVTVQITQDTSGIEEQIEGFVTAYNDLMANLTEITKFDVDTGESGVFQGESTITRLRSSINREILYINADNQSLDTFGLSLNEAGVMEYDKSVLTSEFSKDPTAVENFFKGNNTTINGEDVRLDGVFFNLNETLDGYLNSSTGILSTFEQSLDTSAKNLEKERLSAISRLDDKYSIMANRFAAYDAVISGLNQSFSALQSQIDAAANAK